MDIQTNQFEKKYTSKTYRFFNTLYKLLVINIMTIIMSLPIVTMFPMIVAATATIKNDFDKNGVFKPLFINFKHYFFKSFKMGICLLLVYAVGIYAIYFWATATTESNIVDVIMQVAIVVVPVCLLIFTFMIVHIPLLLITFEKLTNFEIFRTALFVSIRYFLTTLLMLFAALFVIGMFIMCMVVPGLLAVWMILGISLPLFLVVKVTIPVYYRFAKIDFKKIEEEVEEDLKNE